jgi:translation initiation factor 2B subunit (eIF-2B alpha/beta/delta family)
MREYPLMQSDVPEVDLKERHLTASPRNALALPPFDYTPPALITLLITDTGKKRRWDH